jgi:hypothetical protein
MGNGRGLAASGNAQTKSLPQAAIDCDVEQLKLHIAKGANLNTPDQFGFTPLMRVIQKPSVEAAKLLIESGKVDVNAKDRSGRTPLIVCASTGEKEIIELLLAHEANVKAKDDNDWTALHSAVQFGQLDIIETLVKKGADVNATAKTGQTPYTMALQQAAGRPEIAELLKKNGGKEPQLPELYGNSPGAGIQPGPQAAVAAPRRPIIAIDPNEIQKQMKQFEGLAAAIKKVDDKSLTEQRTWIQSRSDNRIALLAAMELQFGEELGFVKPIAVEEKAEKTVKAIDNLTATRKKRTEQINEQLRDQRRTTMAQTRQSAATGPAGARGARGRGPAGNMGAAGSSMGNPYGNPTAKTPLRRPGDANQPAIDPNTQAQIQAWLNAKADDKKALLQAVDDLNLAELQSLQELALKEQAKKTTVAIMSLMMLREQRAEKIALGWQEEEARMQKLQERYGPNGMAPGRGMQGNQQQQTQPGMRGGRRGR